MNNMNNDFVENFSASAALPGEQEEAEPNGFPVRFRTPYILYTSARYRELRNLPTMKQSVSTLCRILHFFLLQLGRT